MKRTNAKSSPDRWVEEEEDDDEEEEAFDGGDDEDDGEEAAASPWCFLGLLPEAVPRASFAARITSLGKKSPEGDESQALRKVDTAWEGKAAGGMCARVTGKSPGKESLALYVGDNDDDDDDGKGEGEEKRETVSGEREPWESPSVWRW